jgi:hypothetical protein
MARSAESDRRQSGTSCSSLPLEGRAPNRGGSSPSAHDPRIEARRRREHPGGPWTERRCSARNSCPQTSRNRPTIVAGSRWRVPADSTRMCGRQQRARAATLPCQVFHNRRSGQASAAESENLCPRRDFLHAQQRSRRPESAIKIRWEESSDKLPSSRFGEEGRST